MNLARVARGLAWCLGGLPLLALAWGGGPLLVKAQVTVLTPDALRLLEADTDEGADTPAWVPSAQLTLAAP